MIIRILLFLLTLTFSQVTFASDSLYVIRVNVHLMQNEDGSGNFRKEASGSDKNGYAFAQELINFSNWFLGQNKAMHLFKGDTPPEVLPVPFTYQLQDVYFHRDDTLSDYSISKRKELLAKYGINSDSVINIFLVHYSDDTPSGKRKDGGVAGCLGCGVHPVLVMSSPWERYKKYGDFGSFPTLLNHEMGHLFGLRHNYYADGCDDTPTHNNSWCGHEPDSGVYVDNNVMSYNCDQVAWTPCQLEKVTTTLEEKYANYFYREARSESINLPLFSLVGSVNEETPLILDGSWRPEWNKNEKRHRVKVSAFNKVKNRWEISGETEWLPGSYDKIVLDNLIRRKRKYSKYRIHLEFEKKEGGHAVYEREIDVSKPG